MCASTSRSKWTFLYLPMLLLGLCWSTSCGGSKELQGVKVPEDFLVRIQRGACFGMCPTYDLLVKAPGQVVFNGYQNAPYEGLRQASISQSDLKAMIKAVEEADFFSLDPRYDDPRISDLPTFTLEIQLDGQRHQVVDRADPPEALEQLQARLLEIIDIEARFAPVE